VKLTIPALQLIADLCRVVAGDTNSINSVPHLENQLQMDCHAYYAECLKTKDIAECMIARPAFVEKALRTQAKTFR
jgi:hypothetical protein